MKTSNFICKADPVVSAEPAQTTIVRDKSEYLCKADPVVKTAETSVKKSSDYICRQS